MNQKVSPGETRLADGQEGLIQIFGLISLLIGVVILVILYLLQQSSLQNTAQKEDLHQVIIDTDKKAKEFNQKVNQLNSSIHDTQY